MAAVEEAAPFVELKLSRHHSGPSNTRVSIVVLKRVVGDIAIYCDCQRSCYCRWGEVAVLSMPAKAGKFCLASK